MYFVVGMLCLFAVPIIFGMAYYLFVPVRNLFACRQCKLKQAKIDQLMLEFCPNEMTPEQRAKWARKQVVVPKEVIHTLGGFDYIPDPADPKYLKLR